MACTRHMCHVQQRNLGQLFLMPERSAVRQSLMASAGMVVACFALVLATDGNLFSVRVMAAPAQTDEAFASGVAMVPKDAAFVSSTLRLREQYQAFLKSNACAAIKKLPAVARAIESIEEQTTQPGSPLSMVATFMELPENEQALELLNDMISTDTFLYGEPSCVTFLDLMKKLQQAQQAAAILQMASGDRSLGGIDIEAFQNIEADGEQEMDEDEDDGAAVPRRGPVWPVRFQVAEADEELADPISAQELTTRLLLQTLIDNVDSIVIPDLVWGFQTTKLDSGRSQLKRIEVLLKLFTQANSDLSESLERRTIKGVDVVTFTLKGHMVPWDELVQEAAEGMEIEGLDAVVEKLRSLHFVVAIGVIGDRVILSIGDSADHLEKLVIKNDGESGLLATKPLEPLLAHKDKPITSIAYMSQSLATSLAPSADDIAQMAKLSDLVAEAAGLPEGAAADARKNLARVAEGYKKRLPVPGPWLGFSFRAPEGYEGYSWNWTGNLPVDGSKRLELLEHTGGAPLGAIVFRAKAAPGQFEDFVLWSDMGWSFFKKYLLPKADENARDQFDEVEEHLGPLGTQFLGVLRKKIIPSLADGQIGFVLDAKSKTKKIQNELPESAQPLPIFEPAIVLGLSDPKLFREGMSDLFALGDELVDQIRELSPDALPADYRVPEPESSKVEGGMLWSFAIPDAGLDEQVKPSIGVGADAAVFAFLPKQVGRLLIETRLETGSQLSKFDEPLAGAATLDVAGLVDAVQPWIVYLTRYGCVQQRDGEVDKDTELTADVENEQAKDALKQVAVVLDVLRSLRVAVAETAIKSDATVTHWQNVIRDLPAE